MELLDRIETIVAERCPISADAAGAAEAIALCIEDPRNDGPALREALLLLIGLTAGGPRDEAMQDAVLDAFAREFHLGPRLSAQARDSKSPAGDAESNWAALALRYPWPALPVGEASPDEGRPFCRPGPMLLLNEAIRLFRPRLIVEVGSGDGAAACYILRRCDARLVAVDTWLAPESRPAVPLPSRHYDAFVRNAWQERRRIVPMRTTAVAAFHKIRACGLEPDLVFHRGVGHPRLVAAELEAARRLLPGAKVIVDDYAPGEPSRRPVVDAVDAFAAEHRREIVVAESSACLLLPR